MAELVAAGAEVEVQVVEVEDSAAAVAAEVV